MKLSNLHSANDIILTISDNLFIGDIPINEETKYYGHMLRDGDQIIFTFSDVNVNNLAQYVGGVSVRIYVKHLGGKKFKIAGVLFNLRNAYVWDYGSYTYVDIEDENGLKRSLAEYLAKGMLQANKPTKITNILSYIKDKLNELILERIPSNDPEPSANDLKAREELRRKQESERKTRENTRQERELDVKRRKEKADMAEIQRLVGALSRPNSRASVAPQFSQEAFPKRDHAQVHSFSTGKVPDHKLQASIQLGDELQKIAPIVQPTKPPENDQEAAQQAADLRADTARWKGEVLAAKNRYRNSVGLDQIK
jgi:hypothetical protein